MSCWTRRRRPHTSFSDRKKLSSTEGQVLGVAIENNADNVMGLVHVDADVTLEEVILVLTLDGLEQQEIKIGLVSPSSFTARVKYCLPPEATRRLCWNICALSPENRSLLRREERWNVLLSDIDTTTRDTVVSFSSDIFGH